MQHGSLLAGVADNSLILLGILYLHFICLSIGAYGLYAIRKRWAYISQLRDSAGNRKLKRRQESCCEPVIYPSRSVESLDLRYVEMSVDTQCPTKAQSGQVGSGTKMSGYLRKSETDHPLPRITDHPLPRILDAQARRRYTACSKLHAALLHCH